MLQHLFEALSHEGFKELCEARLEPHAGRGSFSVGMFSILLPSVAPQGRTGPPLAKPSANSCLWRLFAHDASVPMLFARQPTHLNERGSGTIRQQDQKHSTARLVRSSSLSMKRDSGARPASALWLAVSCMSGRETSRLPKKAGHMRTTAARNPSPPHRTPTVACHQAVSCRGPPTSFWMDCRTPESKDSSHLVSTMPPDVRRMTTTCKHRSIVASGPSWWLGGQLPR